MATFWLSTSGTDTASGTNFANAQKTLAGLKSELGQGDIVNVVNDGDHPASATDTWFNLVYSGTNYDTDPGMHIRGTDSDGNPAIATVALTAGAKEWVGIDDLCDYFWVEGIRFDGSALRGTAETNVRPVQVTGQAGNVRLNDCEMVMTTVVGESVDLSTNTQVMHFPYASGASVAHAGTVEVYNNVLINARLNNYNFQTNEQDYHNNVQVIDCLDYPSTELVASWSSGTANADRKFYKNTLVFIPYDTHRPDQSVVNMNQNNTTSLVFHSNLVYVDTGSNAATSVANYLLDGSSVAAQTTTVVTCSNNYIAIGPYLALEATDWDTSTVTGVYGRQLNSAWRGGGSENGTALNTDDVLDRSSGLDGVFNDYTSSYTWTPGDYDHDLPCDLRPLVGRTDALGGGIVGAIDDAINADPVVIPHTYTATCGVLKSVNSTLGLLAGSSDPDGDTLSATIVAGPSHGVAVLNTTTGAFGYTPNITYTGTDTFTYKAWDGTTFSNVSTATVNISNQTPTGYPMNYYMGEGQTLSITSGSGLLIRATDPDVGQTLSVTGVGTPAHGTLISYNTTTGSFVYDPDNFFSGFDEFEFQVTDGNTSTEAHTATIYVIPAQNDDADSPEFVDAAPFFRPTLYVQTEFSFRNTKNRVKDLDLRNYTEKDNKWNEATSRVITVAAGSTIEITMGGVSSAQYLILETDQSIEVSIDGTAKYWPVSKMVALALTEASALHLHSLSTTNAQVILTMAD